ncbi:hypothetical protein [Accumulibacter sp.]|jgi:hypothetical protein|uniref:Uncharacterized protein n=1 Tax=Accumulibacter regalis TaxID=522306 RepID=C7RUJ6_ACCRE|nr:hypothetical protein [Accumulibacter sp.]MBN8498556.1 hypothetical protein [Accumulibacter sp.]MBO3714983.1 hypothetical protein [Accumulibacter sp.]
MAVEDGLWETSAAWRWTVVITLLLSGLAYLFSPWRNQGTGTPPLATYKAPPTVAIGKASFNRTQPASTSNTSVSTAASRLNPAFDVGLPSLNSPFPQGTEVHMIGVYQGALPNGQKEQPWWAKCMAFKDDSTAMAECHSKYAGLRSTRSISVEVSRSPAPMVLVLMSYDPVLWRISVNPRSRIAKIILAGYHGQDVDGIANSIPVEVRTHEASPCRNCSRQGEYFYAYNQDSKEFDDASRKIQKITGVVQTSFQGGYQADRFAISDTTTANRTPANSTDDKGDVYTGNSFKEQILIAGQTVSLPTGDWRGLAYINTASKRGQDKLVALGKYEGRRCSEMIAIRIQVVADSSGFPQFSGCKTTPRYAGDVQVNESFGPQMCYEVTHMTDAWSQPFLASVATQMARQGSSPPTTVLASSFHKTDRKLSVDLLHYAIPEDSHIARNEDWNSSIWHPNNIDKSAERGRFTQERIQSATTWYQIFSLSL